MDVERGRNKNELSFGSFTDRLKEKANHPTVSGTLIVFLILSVVMLVFGIINKDKCPIDDRIPIYLIVAGAVGIVSMILPFINRKLDLAVLTIIIVIIYIFEFVWMISLSYHKLSFFLSSDGYASTLPAMEGKVDDDSVPLWKKELIMRIRNKNKWYFGVEQLLAGTPRNASVAVGCAGQQPNITCSSAASVPVVNSSEANNIHENGDDCSSVDSNSSEELHYGPGIVNKLKNRYLSLTLRENNTKIRPSILPIRKATSLENLLDDDVPNGKATVPHSREYNSRWKENNARNLSNRSNIENYNRRTLNSNEQLANDVRLKHESLHEDMLIVTEGNDKLSGKLFDKKLLEITTENKPFSNAVPHIINRPKRITPVMSEKEKPPVDVVKQAKRIFEGKAEQRTKPPQQTGEVAAKVASYKNIIGQVKNGKKPPIPKEKPSGIQDNKKVVRSPENTKLQKPTKLPISAIENGWKKDEKSLSPDVASIRTVSSPIPDVSRINSPNREDLNHQSRITSNLSETPDLILHSSPIKTPPSPTFKILATDNFLKAEILHSNNNLIIKINQFDNKPRSPSSPTKSEIDGKRIVTQESRNNIGQAGNTTTYNLSNSTDLRSHLPGDKCSKLSSPIQNTHINNVDKTLTSPKSILPSQTNLTPQEIEKNSKNIAKTLEQNVPLSSPLFLKCDEVKRVEVPKATLPKLPKDQNSIVFKFTDRKDVPDYVGNDGKNRAAPKLEKPKVGEGGIILLPGASLDESITDDDDEWMLSLEGPPSPCDVVFINDNVLIDGRSSLNQKNKTLKMKIKFVETVPEIYEYPSEASLLDDNQLSSRESSPGHVVPNISGSSLASYIPKSGSTEDFQLGITRSTSTQQHIVETKNSSAFVESEMQEVDEPILFSAGTNSDILF
ncbi:hypothetical protein RI129_000627 [Pyrocoelia pectoralis]|uniref:Uncharacterized protein n=1 Tax=Pyrocoelia pectoralis TaxID=417401 RepID=A0AAN7ZW75_9COLE